MLVLRGSASVGTLSSLLKPDGVSDLDRRVKDGPSNTQSHSPLGRPTPSMEEEETTGQIMVLSRKVNGVPRK
ncbi:hypothetical protein P168DRAFT_63587 [Aspergillus campestris IBT 28561]|uniref:Uncharacterized protein n=1 Tax=Aspergillus campestris (strain IBT 28561) TaxID=1392248 RepID=A0A2I1CSU3_ASPC2|nr:uncharacterized protein P168DRAFT_63587 [Aspergillus campestris IBT 28561]PKY00696.1 hypothetical protein P168DRAFT_63587 [Aspergillus campestris IBT 28561]